MSAAHPEPDLSLVSLACAVVADACQDYRIPDPWSLAASSPHVLQKGSPVPRISCALVEPGHPQDLGCTGPAIYRGPRWMRACALRRSYPVLCRKLSPSTAWALGNGLTIPRLGTLPLKSLFARKTVYLVLVEYPHPEEVACLTRNYRLRALLRSSRYCAPRAPHLAILASCSQTGISLPRIAL